jgi:hypothetical protein
MKLTLIASDASLVPAVSKAASAAEACRWGQQVAASVGVCDVLARVVLAGVQVCGTQHSQCQDRDKGVGCRQWQPHRYVPAHPGMCAKGSTDACQSRRKRRVLFTFITLSYIHIAAQAGLQSPHLDIRLALSRHSRDLSSCTESHLCHSQQVPACQSTARLHQRHPQCMRSTRTQVCLQCSTRAHVGACMHQRQAICGVCVCRPNHKVCASCRPCQLFQSVS